MARRQREERARQTDLEGGVQAHLLHKFGQLLKVTLVKAPSQDTEMCTWLDGVKSTMIQLKVPENIRGKLLLPFLNERAKLLVVKMPEGTIDNWDEFTKTLITGFQQTTSQLLRTLNNAQRKPNESFKNFSFRLEAMYRHYLNSRKVTNFNDIVELLISDRIKTLMSDEMRAHIVGLELETWMRPDKLCDVADSLATDNMRLREAERAATANWRSRPPAKFVPMQNVQQNRFVRGPQSDKPASANGKNNQFFPQRSSDHANQRSADHVKPVSKPEFVNKKVFTNSAHTVGKSNVNRVATETVSVSAPVSTKERAHATAMRIENVTKPFSFSESTSNTFDLIDKLDRRISIFVNGEKVNGLIQVVTSRYYVLVL